MQYLLMDTHQRFLGIFKSQQVLSVGDTFQSQNAQTYAVIGMNWSGRTPNSQSVTVIPIGSAPKEVDREPAGQLVES